MIFDNMKHPHEGQPVLEKGAPLDEAKGAVILIHGRGASAESIMSFYDSLNGSGLSWLAPQANHSTWYPYTFLSPIEQNEPGYSSALQIIADLVDKVTGAGIPKEKIILAGFSQGACLASEYAARNPDRYGGVVALSGGLIGDVIEQDRYQGSMDGTPVFLGCSDIDHHIPEERVHETADVFNRLDAKVTKKIYEGMGHTINEDELQYFQNFLNGVRES